jgi:uncharacterized protein
MDRLMRLAIALLACAVTAAALDLSALKPQGYVSDFAGVVDAGAREALERYLKQVESATGAQIALVTLRTLDGEPIEDAANRLFRQWGIGKKETNEGILLLLVIEERKSRLEVGYGLEPYIPDGFAGSVLREMRPALRAGRYGEALLAAAQAIGSRIAQAKGVELGAAPGAERRQPVSEPVPWGPLIGLLVLFLWLAAVGGRSHYRRRGGVSGGDLLTGILVGNLLGRGAGGYRGRTSGGFGGFDSSGGFGGFGGGDSGGGGASSSW